MTTPDHYERAISTLGLPADWQVIVAVRPRRRTLAIEIRPGGTVAILVPPTAPPERVAAFVAGSRAKIADEVGATVALAPDFAVKHFVQDERYDLVGRAHQLRLVGDDRAGRTPRIDLDGSGEPLLVVCHGPPELPVSVAVARPTVVVAGVLVALYVDAEEQCVIVSVDLDTTATWLRRDEYHTVPLQIAVQGEPVFEG
jgi:hypothetical protein